ncbi:hypothetical protein H5410_026068 [Solanum commersonii]|uniref:Uncharacterized protein n=1 Tax=Solanum commersonii TaxID=4109 RepID=A0A9J5YXM3_SOLCO|nr:hypothetical protein H5410_026057 [Solanum commersonii]KAG5604576.1 hypothetical protein H5410_026068 [Solanum commersonii]
MDSATLKDSYNEEIIEKLTEDFTEQLSMKQQIIEEDGYEDYEEEEVEDDVNNENEEEEFSFACGIDAPPIAADEVFYNGQIRPLFPLFNQNLLLSDEDLEALKEQLPIRPPVKKIFIQTEDNPIPATSSEEIAGPFCEWSKNKAIEATRDNPEVCRKSNSTGFSKLWRFKDFLHRSNSDGRDTFVFLNPTTPAAKVEEKVVRKDETTTSEKKKKEISGEVKVIGKVTKKTKKVVKKSEGILAHEAYMKSKAKAEDRRRSYLPYRPELVGFFTNVNGGLTKNVHPF